MPPLRGMVVPGSRPLKPRPVALAKPPARAVRSYTVDSDYDYAYGGVLEEVDMPVTAESEPAVEQIAPLYNASSASAAPLVPEVMPRRSVPQLVQYFELAGQRRPHGCLGDAYVPSDDEEEAHIFAAPTDGAQASEHALSVTSAEEDAVCGSHVGEYTSRVLHNMQAEIDELSEEEDIAIPQASSAAVQTSERQRQFEASMREADARFAAREALLQAFEAELLADADIQALRARHASSSLPD